MLLKFRIFLYLCLSFIIFQISFVLINRLLIVGQMASEILRREIFQLGIVNEILIQLPPS